MTEDERSVWEALVAAIIHPTKVYALEAMEWIERPLCADDIAEIGDEKVNRGLASYHLKQLETAGVIKLDHTKQVRGAFERYFVVA